MIDGTIRVYPVAHLEVDTPYFFCEVKALVMDRPVYDVILGKIPGVREPHDPDLTWKPKWRRMCEGNDGVTVK